VKYIVWVGRRKSRRGSAPHLRTWAKVCGRVGKAGVTRGAGEGRKGGAFQSGTPGRGTSGPGPPGLGGHRRRKRRSEKGKKTNRRGGALPEGNGGAHITKGGGGDRAQSGGDTNKLARVPTSDVHDPRWPGRARFHRTKWDVCGKYPLTAWPATAPAENDGDD